MRALCRTWRCEFRNQRFLDLARLVVIDLTGAGRPVATAAIAQAKRADIDLRTAIDDRFADGEYGVLLLEPPQYVDGDAALRKQRVDHEAVAGKDQLFIAQIEHNAIAMRARATQQLLAKQRRLLTKEVELAP